MVRIVVLVAINVTAALLMAASIMPVAMVLAPFVRETPATGYAIFGAATAFCVGMNVLLWTWWKKRS
jgi:hypothetical protein